MSKLEFIKNKIAERYHIDEDNVMEALYEAISDKCIIDKSAYEAVSIEDIIRSLYYMMVRENPGEFDDLEIDEEETAKDIIVLLDALMEEDISKRPDISHITDFDIAIDELATLAEKEKNTVKNVFLKTFDDEIHHFKDLNKTKKIRQIIQDKIGFSPDDEDFYDYGNAVFKAAMRFMINSKIEELQAA